MGTQQLLATTQLLGCTDCTVSYHPSSDMVEVAIGVTTLRFEAHDFIVMHEMLRKAAAKIVMQTALAPALVLT